MTLFEFYEEKQQQGLDVIALKWELVDTHILYHKRKCRESRERLKEKIGKFRAIKEGYPQIYKKVWDLAFSADQFLKCP